MHQLLVLLQRGRELVYGLQQLRCIRIRAACVGDHGLCLLYGGRCCLERCFSSPAELCCCHAGRKLRVQLRAEEQQMQARRGQPHKCFCEYVAISARSTPTLGHRTAAALWGKGSTPLGDLWQETVEACSQNEPGCCCWRWCIYLALCPAATALPAAHLASAASAAETSMSACFAAAAAGWKLCCMGAWRAESS